MPRNLHLVHPPMPNPTPRETPLAIRAFYEYCLMEDRSLAKLAKTWRDDDGKCRVSVGQLERWSAQHHWPERVKQFEKERAEKRLAKSEEARYRMDEEQALIARTQSLAMVKYLEMLRTEGRLTDSAAVSYFGKLTTLERTARGAATERSEITGKDGGPIETRNSETGDLTDEDLRLVMDLARQLREQKYGEHTA